MHPAIKMIVGFLILAAGLYWYATDVPYMGATLSALKTVLAGTIGVVLILLGLLIVWIEYEEMKYQS